MIDSRTPTSLERADRTEVARRAREPVPRTGASPYLWDPFALFRDDIDRLFDRHFRPWSLREQAGRDGWGLDIREAEDAIVIEAEAPGFEPGDFDIQVEDDRLILKAVRKSEDKDQDRGYRSWRQQELHRVIQLPSSVDPEKIEAKYRNGLLIVSLPRSERAVRKRIEVK